MSPSLDSFPPSILSTFMGEPRLPEASFPAVAGCANTFPSATVGAVPEEARVVEAPNGLGSAALDCAGAVREPVSVSFPPASSVSSALLSSEASREREESAV